MKEIESGIDFEMQELLNSENEKYIFKIFKKTINTETKITGHVYLETFIGTRKEFLKLNYDTSKFLIEKSKYFEQKKEVKTPYLGHLNMKYKFKGIN